MNPFRKTSRISRAIVITPLGYDILRQVAAGTYKFAPSLGGGVPAGTRLHKGKRRSKFVGTNNG